jgi:hypothetical protein
VISACCLHFPAGALISFKPTRASSYATFLEGLVSSLSLFWDVLANITCYPNSFSGAILADATQTQPSSLFSSLAPGVASTVEATANMAHSRAITPARSTTPARGKNPNPDRQCETNPLAATGHRTITTSAGKGMNISWANESRSRLLEDASVGFGGRRCICD